MAVRFYIVPAEEIAGPPARGPRYMHWRYAQQTPRLTVGVRWSAVDYGREPLFLVAADVEQADHDFLAAQPDVIAFPSALDDTVSDAAALSAALEARDIPAQWVRAQLTNRQVLGVVKAIFHVAQRMNGLGSGFVPAGVTLDTRDSDMPTGYRTALVQALGDLGYDRTGLTDSDRLRDILGQVASQARHSRMMGELV